MQIFALHVTHVQIDGKRLAGTLTEAFASNRPGNNIARSQLRQWMIALHKSLAVMVAQICPFASQRFRQ